MNPDLKLVLVVGARPNFMKVAPLLHAIARHNASPAPGRCRIQPTLVHTGQHYDAKMSEVFFQDLGMPAPDINLEVGSGSHAVQTAEVMKRFEPVLESTAPDWVLVPGDVNSTLACALVASKMGVKVAHLEAGLRSFDRSMPEEINRIVTDTLSDLLLTPSEDANENLRREGIPDRRIRLVGNIMIDSLVTHLDRARQCGILDQCGVAPRQFAYVTLHRPSNVDQPGSLAQIIAALAHLSQQVPIVFPIHPRTRKKLAEHNIPLPAGNRIRLLDPIGYHESLCLAESARLVLTDSGGLQEETTYFRTPCLTLRPNTERPVTITHGSNRLTSPERLDAEIQRVLDNGTTPPRIPPLWDGQTAPRILDLFTAPGGL